MKELFRSYNEQPTGRIRPSRIATCKVKRGPAKGKRMKMSVSASIAVSMMSVIKGRRSIKQGLTEVDIARINEQHRMINSGGYINRVFGSMGSR